MGCRMTLFCCLAGLLGMFPAGAASPPLTVLLRRSGLPERYAGRVVPGKVLIPSVYRAPGAEMRGVWFITHGNIDFPRQKTDAEFRAALRNVFSALAARHFNTVFFQVRPDCDAYYASRINPWSRSLTGVEGVPLPGHTDPLTVAVQEARRHGMKLYAWFNPYRVTEATRLTKLRYLATLSPGNFARKNPHLVLSVPLKQGRSLLFLNPGEPEVIRHVTETVREIAEKYPVDGVVFDDYFYPYMDIGNADAASFVKNNPRNLSRKDWRVENVNRLILSVRGMLKSCQKKTGRPIPFGISPFGIWANRRDRAGGSLSEGDSSLLTLYADSRGWVRRNEIDFVIPQIYWSFGHNTAAYAALADWWTEQVRGTRVKLYIGMAAYRVGEAGDWQNPYELLNQIRYNTKHPEIAGQVFCNTRSVLYPANAIQQNTMRLLLTRYWTTRVPDSRAPFNPLVLSSPQGK